MTIWETIKAAPDVWFVIVLFVVTLLAGIWRGAEWLIERRRKR